MSATDQSQYTPPYSSWSMFESTLERMRQDGLPARVDRSYLSSASGSVRAQLTATFKSLGLVDDELHPTDALRELAENPEARPTSIKALLERYYGPILSLDQNATQHMLEEAFRDNYGIQGSTVRRAISFYLAAAKVAGISVSSMFATPRTGSNTSRRRRSAKSKVDPDPAPQRQADPFADLRTKYVETLLDKFAAANGEVDDELADRIERLVGFEPTSRSKGNQD